MICRPSSTSTPTPLYKDFIDMMEANGLSTDEASKDSGSKEDTYEEEIPEGTKPEPQKPKNKRKASSWPKTGDVNQTARKRKVDPVYSYLNTKVQEGAAAISSKASALLKAKDDDSFYNSATSDTLKLNGCSYFGCQSYT